MPEIPLKPQHHLVLLLLAQEPVHGLELLERLEQRSGGAIRLNAGSLYRLIGQLAEEGLIEPLDPVLPPGGPGAPRKRYRVTDAGRSLLREEARRQSAWLELARSLDLAPGS
jgi:DNA-binding PadR family transcriptional regulator